MIENGTMTKLGGPQLPDGDGGYAPAVVRTFDQPVMCTIDQLTLTQQKNLEGSLGKVSAMLYVKMRRLPAGVEPVKGGTCTANLRGMASITYRIADVKPHVHGSLSHFELFLEVA